MMSFNSDCRIRLAALSILSSAALTLADDGGVSSNGGPREERIQCWQNSKFGMFVHWGVYSVPAGVHNGMPVRHLGEWIMYHGRIPKADYAKYANALAPEGYDPAAWVALAKEAGMKYMVVTAKHHDGFALFDSKVSDWTAVNATPSHRDLLMPLVVECRKQGMPLGFHYSQAQDWWHPGGARSGTAWDESQNGSFDDYLAKIAVPQIKELIDNYGPVASFFFDTPLQMNAQRAVAIGKILPASTLTNDRLYGGSRGTYKSYESRLPPNPDRDRPWELCLSCNDTWGYKSADQNWKSASVLLRTLIDAVSQGGNVLLNVGPDANGRIPEPAVNTLKEIGAWMAKNGESIYSTRRSPYPGVPWKGGCTTRALPNGNSALYAHLYDWPGNRELRLPGLASPVVSARLLPDGPDVKTTRQGNSLILRLPTAPENGIAVVRLELRGQPVIEKPAIEPDGEGRLNLTAGLAILSGKNLRLERRQDYPESNIGWWTETGDTAAWWLFLPAAAEYAVNWNFSCSKESAGSIISVRTDRDDELARFEVPSTGSWDNFHTFKSGTVKLPAGLTQLRLVPVSKSGPGVVNLRSVLLEKLR